MCVGPEHEHEDEGARRSEVRPERPALEQPVIHLAQAQGRQQPDAEVDRLAQRRAAQSTRVRIGRGTLDHQQSAGDEGQPGADQ